MERISKKSMVAAAIGDWISSGRYGVGMQLPTERELMNEFSVSRIVIREAIGTLVADRILSRRQGAGTFVTAEALQPARRPLPLQLAAMVPSIQSDNNTYHSILDGIEAKAAECGLTVVLFNHQNRLEHARLGITRLAAQGIRLLVYTPLEIRNFDWSNRQVLRQAARANMRVVLVDKTIWGGAPRSVSFVGSNGYDGIRAVVRRLADLGHRRIGCLMNNLSNTGRLRYSSFIDALRECNLPLDKQLYQVDYERLPLEEEGCRGAEFLLSLPEPPTAVVCAHDWMARNFYRVAAKFGVRIPEDISVSGFDDLPLASDMIPSLTTVRQPLHEVGSRAVELLAAEYTASEVPEMQHIYLNTTPVFRNSTAAPRKDPVLTLHSNSLENR